MSDRICYIQRTDRGARIGGLRLLSERSAESWTSGGANDAASAEHTALEGAAWLRERLAETRTPKRLDTLCLDVDGAVCSWIKGRDADAELIRSAVEGSEVPASTDEEDGLDPVQTPGVADRLPRLPLEVSYGLLGETSTDARAAVLAAPDAPARLLLDEIDRLGVRVDRVITLWHAMAEAWDPGAKAAQADSPAIVSTDHPPAAVVLIEHPPAHAAGHATGRLVWAWSRAGTLLACGSIRIRAARAHADTPEPGQTARPAAREALAEVHPHDIARLASDWLGWSAQIGVCPGRVVVVGHPADTGMTHAEIGTALTRAWPGALTDLHACDDAVAETLRRTLDTRHIGTFAPLTARPTRAHRGAYRWGAAALLVAAACVGVMGVLLFARAGTTRDLSQGLRAERTELLRAVDPALVLDPLPVRALETQISAIERRTGAVRGEAPRPILNELEAVSLVLGIPGLTVTEIDLTDTNVTIKARTATVPAGEELAQSLRRVGGSQLRWADPRPTTSGNMIDWIYLASWPEAVRTAP